MLQTLLKNLFIGSSSSLETLKSFNLNNIMADLANVSKISHGHEKQN